jgi:hypothetical protein
MLDELRQHILTLEQQRPRARQAAIGISEIGNPCARRHLYKLTNTPKTNTGGDPWPAIIGTAVHTYLDQAFGGHPDWITDQHVTIPTTDGGSIGGTIDLYHQPSGTVIDHKVVGTSSLKRMRQDGPGPQYRTQVHLYGLGMQLAGHTVTTVAIMAWPRAGQLKDAHYWSEPWDPDLCDLALNKLASLQAVATMFGDQAPARTPGTESHCMYCPWFMPAATNPSEACPGPTLTR